MELQSKAHLTNIRPAVGMTKSYNKKRNVYLLIILIAIFLVLFLISNARHLDNALKNTDKNEVEIAPRDSMAGKSPVVLERNPDRYIAGVDIEPGRYMVTAETGFGGFVVYEVGTEYPEISEAIGYFADPHYIPSVAVTLVDTQEIMIYGSKLNRLTFTPLDTELLTELCTGVWVVGMDILPGTYVVRSKDGRSGDLTLFDGDLPIARVSLGDSGGAFKTSEIITIKEGEIIRISNIPTVSFEQEELI